MREPVTQSRQHLSTNDSQAAATHECLIRGGEEEERELEMQLHSSQPLHTLLFEDLGFVRFTYVFKLIESNCKDFQIVTKKKNYFKHYTSKNPKKHHVSTILRSTTCFENIENNNKHFLSIKSAY